LLGWTSLPEAEKNEIVKSIDSLTKQGKRLIGFARKEVALDKKNLVTSDAKEGLSWVGLLAFSDPVRLGVKDALELAYNAGIRTAVITGDYSKTSEFVLFELGISIKKSEILLGSELENMTPDELSQKVKLIKLFARTSPDQKLRIVEAMKKTVKLWR